MNNKLILVFITILIILLSSCTKQNKQEEALNIIENKADVTSIIDTESISVPTEEEKKEIKLKEEKIKLIKEEYRNEEIIQGCSSTNMENCLVSLIETKISETGDIDLCNDVIGEKSQNYCKLETVTKKNRIEKNILACELLDDDIKTECLINSSIELAITSSDLSYCDSLNDNNKSICTSSVVDILVTETGEKKWCDELVGTDTVASCN